MPPSHLKRQPTEDDCRKWRQSKLLNPEKPTNPISGYSIKSNSPIYKELDKECKKNPSPPSSIKKNDTSKSIIKKKTILTKPLTKELCILWSKNKLKNPITNHRISEKSKIYKEFETECKKMLLKSSSSKTYSIFSSKSSSH